MNTTTKQNPQTQFDKELKAILLNDLRRFREERGKFLCEKPGKNQDNDLLVA